MKPYTIAGRVLPALREDFDPISGLGQINVDLTVFAVVFSLDTHSSRARQLITMLNASCLLVGWPCDHYSNLKFEFPVCNFSQWNSGILRYSVRHTGDSGFVKELHGGFERTLKAQEIR